MTFIVSGMLWRNSLIMNDTDTMTGWSHITGKAIMGELKDSQLQRIPSVQTTWADWFREHPDTRLLVKDEDVLSSHYASYFADEDRAGLFRTEWLRDRMPAKEKIVGISVGPFALAVRDERLETGQVVLGSLGEEPVIVARALDGGVRAFRTSIGDRSLTFEEGDAPPADDAAIRHHDVETGSTWDLTEGICLEGELAGQELEPIVSGVFFWFAWSSFYPNTDVIG